MKNRFIFPCETQSARVVAVDLGLNDIFLPEVCPLIFSCATYAISSERLNQAGYR